MRATFMRDNLRRQHFSGTIYGGNILRDNFYVQRSVWDNFNVANGNFYVANICQGLALYETKAWIRLKMWRMWITLWSSFVRHNLNILVSLKCGISAVFFLIFLYFVLNIHSHHYYQLLKFDIFFFTTILISVVHAIFN